MNSPQRAQRYYVHAPIDKCGWFGLWIRHVALKYILDGTSFSLMLQNHRTKWRTRLMEFFSFLGTEDCFICIIPLLTWILDARLGRFLVILLAIGFYSVGFIKCLLCLPRPPSPPVIPLHNENGDWAFPSNHAAVAVLVPWYLWIYSCLHYDWWPWWIQMASFAVALSWFGGVSLSRLYLGVHSVADMLAGAALGACILSIFLIVLGDYIDNKCVTGDYVIPKSLTLAIILMYVHPRTNPETSSYGESVLLMGCAFGVITSRRISIGGTTFSNRLDLLHSENVGVLPWHVLLWYSVLRLTLGTAMIIGGREVLRAFFGRLIGGLYSYLELPVYSYKQYTRAFPQEMKHHTDAYRLPPLYTVEKEEENERFLVEKRVDGNHKMATSRPENGKINHRVTPAKGATTRREADPKQRTLLVGEEESTFGNARKSASLLPYDIDIPTRFIVYSILGWILGEGAPALFQALGV